MDIGFYFFEAVTIRVTILSDLTLCLLVLELADLVYAKDKSGFPHKFVIVYCDVPKSEYRNLNT